MDGWGWGFENTVNNSIRKTSCSGSVPDLNFYRIGLNHESRSKWKGYETLKEYQSDRVHSLLAFILTRRILRPSVPLWPYSTISSILTSSFNMTMMKPIVIPSPYSFITYSYFSKKDAITIDLHGCSFFDFISARRMLRPAVRSRPYRFTSWRAQPPFTEQGLEFY